MGWEADLMSNIDISLCTVCALALNHCLIVQAVYFYTFDGCSFLPNWGKYSSDSWSDVDDGGQRMTKHSTPTPAH